MKLFDDIARNEIRPTNYTEPRFDYLNQSARLEYEKIRNLLEQWFELFPFEAQSELRSRLRSKDDRQHLSAFFELYLYELLSQSGFCVKVHPNIEDQKTHPDFSVLKGGKPQFYLEATLSSSSETKKSATARENRVYDVINKMDSPNFFIGIRVRGTPATPPPGNKIRRFLEAKLAKLDPDEIAKRFKVDGFKAIPSWTWKHDSWQITFHPIPKLASARGKPGVLPIGMLTQGPYLDAPYIGLRESIKNKATKYGNLNLPYVVAINVINDFGTDDIDINKALFGKEQVKIIFRENNLIDQQLGRKPNGAWYGPNGPKNRRVSAALIAVNLFPWRIAKVTPILWHNPWANYPLSPDNWPSPQLVPNFKNNQIEKRDGKSGLQMLRLYPNWPIRERIIRHSPNSY
ncbi:hypothetical protein ISS37_03560 [candidate division KSB1 bacterium]|nr:hypothetical protein [candidate division KSB1 bacterium]